MKAKRITLNLNGQEARYHLRASTSDFSYSVAKYINCLYCYCSSPVQFLSQQLSVCARALCFVLYFCCCCYFLLCFAGFFLSFVQHVECHVNAREQRSKRTQATYSTFAAPVDAYIYRRMLMIFFCVCRCYCIPATTTTTMYRSHKIVHDEKRERLVSRFGLCGTKHTHVFTCISNKSHNTSTNGSNDGDAKALGPFYVLESKSAANA